MRTDYNKKCTIDNKHRKRHSAFRTIHNSADIRQTHRLGGPAFFVCATIKKEYFDTKEILGASPYWRSDVMKNEFKKVSSPQERHDYVVYKMHEDILNQRYHESVQTVLAELKKVIPRIELTGQWSVDVMRNGNDYYIIDMALAENSALNDCVPKNLLRAYPQQWLPGESNS